MRLTTLALVAGLALAGSPAARAADTTFVLEASIACCEAGEHRFGWLGTAASGVDPADVPEPPLPPDAYLAASFRIPGVTSPARWRRDLRADADFTADGREAWELAFAVSSLPAECTVTIAPGLGDPSGLLLVLSGAYADTLAVPAVFTFPLGSDSRLGIEVLESALPASKVTWGAAKSAYR